MLVTLSIVYCLAADPNVCERPRYPMEDADLWQSSVVACMLRGEELAAEWVAEHPKWELGRVRCTPGKIGRPNDI